MNGLSPNVEDDVPWADVITPYDEAHFVTYIRLLDAEATGADWREVAKIVLHRDAAEFYRTRHCWEVHLQRAQWMTTNGYKHLFRR